MMTMMMLKKWHFTKVSNLDNVLRKLLMMKMTKPTSAILTSWYFIYENKNDGIDAEKMRIPKSAIFTSSGEEQRMFSGLRSRWKKPFLQFIKYTYLSMFSTHLKIIFFVFFGFLDCLLFLYWIFLDFFKWPVHVGKSLENLEDNCSHLLSLIIINVPTGDYNHYHDDDDVTDVDDDDE